MSDLAVAEKFPRIFNSLLSYLGKGQGASICVFLLVIKIASVVHRKNPWTAVTQGRAVRENRKYLRATCKTTSRVQNVRNLITAIFNFDGPAATNTPFCRQKTQREDESNYELIGKKKAWIYCLRYYFCFSSTTHCKLLEKYIRLQEVIFQTQPLPDRETVHSLG